MALIKCAECGGEVSSKAAACPKCGAKPPAKTSLVTWIIGGIFLVFVYQCTQLSGFADRPDTSAPSRVSSPASSAGATSSPTPIAPDKVVDLTAWNYASRIDPMTSREVKLAVLASTNSMSLEFPYSGPNYGHLTLRSTSAGPDVMFRIDKGQTMCRSYKHDCVITVRFDDKPAMKFNGLAPSDGSTETAFLDQESKFISEASKAKTIKVSLEIYQGGVQVLEFAPPKPLEWPKP